MNLDDINQEIITILSNHYEFEVMNSVDDDSVRELTLNFKKEFNMDEIKQHLKFDNIQLHIVGCSHILGILIDVHKSHAS